MDQLPADIIWIIVGRDEFDRLLRWNEDADVESQMLAFRLINQHWYRVLSRAFCPQCRYSSLSMTHRALEA
jgi:hypothetical protein